MAVARPSTRPRACRPDVILLDIGLPGLNGCGVAERIRADMELSDILIVAISAYNPVTAQGCRAEAVFDDYLVKPFDHDALLRILSHAREHPSPRLRRGKTDMSS